MTSANGRSCCLIALLILAAVLGVFILHLHPSPGHRRPPIGIINDIINTTVEATVDKYDSNQSYEEFTVQQLLGLTKEGLPVKNQQTLTIVCQLRGELGHNISMFVHALVLWLKLTRQQQALRKQHAANSTFEPFNYRIVLRHQEGEKWATGKWILARDDAQKCFPSSFGQFDFTLGNNPDFDEKMALQNANNWTDMFEGVNTSPQTVQEALDNFIAIAESVRRADRESHHPSTPAANVTNSSFKDSPISLPFLLSQRQVRHPGFVEFIDDFYHEIRSLLQFSTEDCCALRADADETVYHHRNFVQEMPRYSLTHGFEEMGPHQTARDLLGNLNSGDKLAILSRFNASAYDEQLIRDLEDRGVQVRFISGQSGVQDFCFLMSAKKELVGMARSSYFLIASLLGNASQVRSYWLDTNATRHENQGNLRKDYVWRNLELRERYVFEFYEPDRLLG